MLFEDLQTRLAAFNRHRLEPRLADDRACDWLERQFDQQRLEVDWVDRERAQIERQVSKVPTDPERFTAWFEGLAERGPGQKDALFPWLESQASEAEMLWFLRQEVAGEAGFEDLVALTQLQLPVRAKLELARNYWDEMGRGQAGGMHGPMLQHLAHELELPDVPVVVESVALGNLMLALACNRHFAFQSIGALGVIELTAPGRAEKVNAGLKRLGVRADIRRYFAIHSTLDVRHSEAWNREVLAPLVAERPDTAAAIAEGALLRLSAGQRCFRRYRNKLWGEERAAAAQ